MPISRNKPPPPPTDITPLLPPPPDPSTLSFTEPVRALISQNDLKLFTASPTRQLLLAFVTDLNNSILNTPNSAAVFEPPITSQLLQILSHIPTLIEEFPPEDTGSRFGNQSFRPFYDAIFARAQTWHRDAGLALPEDAEKEVLRYFQEAWGNRTRIDYGSGHELNFICWLLCLRQLGLIPPEAHQSLVLRVFQKYLQLMRQLQTTYLLEPAGSHGVWGLDDYQFLPFLFGSAQLYSHPHLRPKSIHSPEILAEFKDEYIYLSCIAFINSIKTTATLRWHSPMLDDISAAKNWGKINSGMLKMYEAEVLGKLPVMQHFLFGGILGKVQGMGEEEETDREGMRHVHSTWGECCGIKVPAAIAARREEEGRELRVGGGRLPFD